MLKLNVNEDNKMPEETSTGYRHRIITLFFSAAAFVGMVFTSVAGFGGQTQQVQQSKDDIRTINERVDKFATKDDIRDLKDDIRELRDDVKKLNQRK